MLPKSIRFRIQFWHGLLLTAITIALSIAYFVYERQKRLTLIDLELQDTTHNLFPTIDNAIQSANPDHFPRTRPRSNDDSADNETHSRLPPPPPLVTRRRNVSMEQLHQQLTRFDAIAYAWAEDRTLLFQSHENLPPPPLPDNLPTARESSYADFGNYRIKFSYARSGMVIAFASDTRKLHSELKTLAASLAALDLAIIAGSIFVGWLLTGRAIRPIAQISDTANRIAAGDRSLRIDTSNTDSELDQLAQVLNNTFEKLDHSFDQQVKFTADASHELRTPVAVILSQLELALSRERSPEEYRDHLQACKNQAEHMRTLLNSLLDLARVDSGELIFHFEPNNLADLLEECIDWLEPLASKKHITFERYLYPVTAYTDSQRISQVIINLLSNAIQHSPENARIRVTLEQDNDFATVRVIDHGPGIPAASLPFLFDRFYRANAARTSSEGSVGLGLAISKAIVDSHHGSIAAETRPNSGATFTVHLPLKQKP